MRSQLLTRALPPQERPTAFWRVLAVLPYVVPLMGSLAFGQEMCDSQQTLACAELTSVRPRRPSLGTTARP